MSSFFERNKKKGLLAALLLLLRRGKGVIALAVLVAILAGVFVLPGGTKIPWAKRGAESAGLRPTGPSFSGMTTFLRSARESSEMASDMGAKKKQLLEKNANRGDSSTSAYLDLGGLPKYAKLSGASGSALSTISGIVNPDQPGRLDRAMKFDKDDFLGGLVKSAEAGVIASGGQMAENSKMADGGKMAELTRGSAINQGEAAVNQALNFQKVPDVGGGDVKLPKGEKYDQLNAETAGNLAMKHCGESGKNCPKDDGGDAPPPPPAVGKPTFYKLAEARAYSVSAAPPTCMEPGCPKEYAHTTAAVVFDGQCDVNSPCPSKIMAAAELDENTSPQVPDQSRINEIKQESMDYYDQTMQCQAADSWAQGERPSPPAFPAELGPKYDKIAADNGGEVAQVAKYAGSQTGGADQDEVVQGQGPKPANERTLMQEMQHLSCAMSCGADGSRQPAEEISCKEWKSAPFVNNLPKQGTCNGGSCDQGACDKDKAQHCKAIGNRMRAVCNALKKIWEVKHQNCPLASGTLDLHDCNQ